MIFLSFRKIEDSDLFKENTIRGYVYNILTSADDDHYIIINNYDLWKLMLTSMELDYKVVIDVPEVPNSKFFELEGDNNKFISFNEIDAKNEDTSDDI